MKSIMKSVRFKEDIIKESESAMKKYNLNFTQFIVNAIKNYLRMLKYQDAVNKSYGAWKNSNHFELNEGIDKYLTKMRKGRKK